MKGRKIGIIAALGGSTAALAMLTSRRAASAPTRCTPISRTSVSGSTSSPLSQRPGNWEVFSVEPNKAMGGAVTAGSFPRSILIPGTDTSIKIYGQVTEVLDYWMSGGNPGMFPARRARRSWR